MRSFKIYAVQKYNMQTEAKKKKTLARHMSCMGAMGSLQSKQIQLNNLMIANNVGDVHGRKRIILKQISCGQNSTSPGQNPFPGYYERDSEFWNSVEGKVFLEWLSDCQILNNDSSPRSQMLSYIAWNEIIFTVHFVRLISS